MIHDAHLTITRRISVSRKQAKICIALREGVSGKIRRCRAWTHRLAGLRHYSISDVKSLHQYSGSSYLFAVFCCLQAFHDVCLLCGFVLSLFHNVFTFYLLLQSCLFVCSDTPRSAACRLPPLAERWFTKRAGLFSETRFQIYNTLISLHSVRNEQRLTIKIIKL